LAQFHHTISEQLNARLSESPKFFGLLVVVSTGYGYVLSRADLDGLFLGASALAYTAVLWASWYLAALGYSFRFLQYSQHEIERTLGWNPRYVPGPEGEGATGAPPPTSDNPFLWFWHLPSIYHPHAAGLALFLALVCFVFSWHCSKCCAHAPLIKVGWIGIVIGFALILVVNRYYLGKFRMKYEEAEPRRKTKETQHRKKTPEMSARRSPEVN